MGSRAQQKRALDDRAFEKLAARWAPVLEWYDGTTCPIDGRSATCSLVGPLVEAFRTFSAAWLAGQRRVPGIGDQWLALETVGKLRARNADEPTERAAVELAKVRAAPLKIGPFEKLRSRWTPILHWYDDADPLCPCRTHVARFVSSWRFFEPAWLGGQRDPAALIEQWIGYWTTRALWRQLVAGVDELGEPLDNLVSISPSMREEIERAAMDGGGLASAPAIDAPAGDLGHAIEGRWHTETETGPYVTTGEDGFPRQHEGPHHHPLGTDYAEAVGGDLGAGRVKASDLLAVAAAPVVGPAVAVPVYMAHPTPEAEHAYEALKARWTALLNWGAATRAPETQGAIVAWDHFSTEWESFTGTADASALRGQEEGLRNAEANAAAHGYVPPAGGAPVHTPDPDRATQGTVAAHQVDDAERALEAAAKRKADDAFPWLIGAGVIGALGLGTVAVLSLGRR